MRPEADQLSYTAANTKARKGYQIVSKSGGITGRITERLEPYLYPVGADPAAFAESRSQVVLGGKVAYVITKNIGRGYDGRRNTLYSHAFVMAKADYGGIGYDGRVLDAHYREYGDPPESLDRIALAPSKPPPPLLTRDLGAALEPALASLFSKRRILLVTDDHTLHQGILSLLPASMRLVPFSTLVADPKRQPDYRVISGPRPGGPGVEKFAVIEPSKLPAFRAGADLTNSVCYYADLIRAQDYGELGRVQSAFDKIPGRSYADRLNLACYYSQYLRSDSGAGRRACAKKVFEISRKLDASTFARFLREVKGDLPLDAGPGGEAREADMWDAVVGMLCRMSEEAQKTASRLLPRPER